MPFCNHCGNEFELGDEKCSKCEAELPKAPEPIPKTEFKDLSIPKLKRFVAGLIDIVIVLVIFFIFISQKRRFIAMILKRGLAFFIPHLYLLLKDSIEGKSIGKLITGIMVYNEKEKKVSGVLDSIIRNWYFAIPFAGPTIFALIIGIQILFGKNRLGDKGAGTIVITDSDYQRIR
ncbi:MAG: hypothetical protein CMM60_00005 [Rhodospirillaceae bacterium]|jgi:uncharacterized RDD family membrane protein YckC|nr:hypothetical protein [Rhodospirillaceae bacterium]|tara:strand:+ start:533 stop:1060 length:528 start_codon:yes stop_codon:yes gene_type:complete